MADQRDLPPAPPIEERRHSVDFKPTADWIRPHVQATLDFCTIYDPETRAKVPIFLATSERPYAAQVAALVRQGKVFPPGALPLPAMALTLLDTVPDPSRGQSFWFRNIQYSDDRTDVWQAHYPTPTNFLFQLDIRSKFEVEVWRLCQLHQQKFYRELSTLTVDMGPFGVQTAISIQTSGPRDASELDPGDDRERAIRKTYNLTVYGHLVTPAWRTRTMRTITLEMQDAVTGDALGEATVEGHVEPID